MDKHEAKNQAKQAASNPAMLRCRGCMRFVSSNKAIERLEHTSAGIENKIYCPRCATMRGIPHPSGPKTM